MCAAVCAALFTSTVAAQVVAAESLPSAARKALATPGPSWNVIRTANAELYFRAGFSAEARSRIAAAAERAIGDNLAWLGAPRTDRLRLFFVGSREEMRPFTGSTPGGWSVTAEGTAFFVANDSVRPALRHETMHLLSWRLWGTPAGTWMSEGLAALSVGKCLGYTVDELNAAMKAADLLVPLDDLRRRFDFNGERGVLHYLQSASLMQHIDRRFGRARLRELWSSGGLARAPEILGIDVATLERDWRSSAGANIPAATWPAIWRDMRSHGCE
jgi:hypothetical protein